MFEAWLQQLLNRIGANDDAASMSDTLFAGQQDIHDDVAALTVFKKGTVSTIVFPIYDDDGDLVTGAAGLDSEVSKDGGTFEDCTNEATEIATSSGMYKLDLTADEMNADIVAVITKTTTSNAKTTPTVIYTSA